MCTKQRFSYTHHKNYCRLRTLKFSFPNEMNVVMGIASKKKGLGYFSPVQPR